MHSMKEQLIFIFLMLCFCLAGGADARVSGSSPDWRDQFDGVTPLPGSQLVSCETSIILRSKERLEFRTVLDPSIIRVAGSKSGNHAVHAVVSDDSRTMVFRPEVPFALGEVVTVSYLPGMRTVSGAVHHSLTFQFITQPKKIPFTDPFSMIDGLPGSAPKFSNAAHPEPLVPRSVSTLPPTFPALEWTSYKRFAPLGELYIASFLSSPGSTPYLIDISTAKDVLFYRQLVSSGFDFKKQPNGLISYYDRYQSAEEVLDSLYHPVNTYRAIGYSTDIHDFRMLPDGHVLIMGDDPEAFRMDTVVAGGDSAAVVDGLVIQELDADKNVVFQWRTFDHYKVTDAVGIDLTASVIDYCHGNALEVDADSNLILSCRHMDEITKIDRNTGDIIWRWGGKNNQFLFVGDTLAFSHQHAIRRIANGDFVLFDNGNLHVPPFSRAMEYSVDQNMKVATVVWEYRNNPDIYGSAMGDVERLDDGSTLICWGTTTPNVTLLAPDNTKVFEESFPTGVYSYRAFLYPFQAPVIDLPTKSDSILINAGISVPESLEVYNDGNLPLQFTAAGHQAWLAVDTAAKSLDGTDSISLHFTINGIGFTQGTAYTDTISIVSNDTRHSPTLLPVVATAAGPTGVKSTPTLPRVYDLSNAYPSPFNPSARIDYQLPSASRVTLRIYDLLGQSVAVLKEGIEDAGYKSVVWNASGFASGAYLYRFEASSVSDPSRTYSKVKKMVLMK